MSYDTETEITDELIDSEEADEAVEDFTGEAVALKIKRSDV
jgi:hypothetical protein